jgi:hypothetical protein
MNKGINKTNIEKLQAFIKQQNEVHNTKPGTKYNKNNLQQPSANK